MTAPDDVTLLVVRLSDSFSDFWAALARELGVPLVAWAPPNPGLPPRKPARYSWRRADANPRSRRCRRPGCDHRRRIEPQLLADAEIARVGEIGAVERALHPNADPGEIGMRLEEVLVGAITVAARFVNLERERVEASARRPA